MIVLEMKAVVKPSQCTAIDEAILTVQFIRNKALRLWMDAKREDKIDKYSLNKYCAVLAKQFKFVDTLNST
ncbi:MAG: transposase, partial [Microcystis sp. M038S2]|nr:transposase [Microcystis sp. M038S2]